MKYPWLYLLFGIILISCDTETPTQFNQEALNDVFIDLNGDEVTFKEVLNKNKGKTVLIDIWANWCRDCIKGLPRLKEFQTEHSDLEYVFLSMDRSLDSWKTGIQKYDMEGQHYYIKSGWDGGFGDFIDLDWIPRYLIIDENGQIEHFKSIRINDLNLLKAVN